MLAPTASLARLAISRGTASTVLFARSPAALVANANANASAAGMTPSRAIASPALGGSSSRGLATEAKVPKARTPSAAATKAKAAKDKERLKLKELRERERAKAKQEREKLKLKAKADKQKEKEKLRADAAKAKAAAKLKPWELFDEQGNKVPLPTETKPKRRGAFVLYMTDKIEQLKHDPQYHRQSADGQSKVSTAAIFAKAGGDWHTLDEAARKPYVDASKRELEEYNRKLAAWEAGLTDVDRKRMEAYNRALRKAGKTRTTKIPPRADAPSKPINAFIEYVKKRRVIAAERGEAAYPLPDFARKLGEEWKNMSEADKQPYQSVADQDLQRYNREMLEYRRRTEA
ncbi:unnamed protein product [Parajaminaea phylloscopi]